MMRFVSAPNGMARTYSSPVGVAVDSSNDVYVTDSGLHELFKISGSTVTAFSKKFIGPNGVAVDTTGNVYVNNARHDHISERRQRLSHRVVFRRNDVGGRIGLPVS